MSIAADNLKIELRSHPNNDEKNTLVRETMEHTVNLECTWNW